MAILNGLKWVGPIGLQAGSGWPIFSHEKKKNAKFLERMNQINQGNKLYIIPFGFFFFFSLSGHLQLLDYLCKLCYCYTWEGKKKKQTNRPKNIKISISFQF